MDAKLRHDEFAKILGFWEKVNPEIYKSRSGTVAGTDFEDGRELAGLDVRRRTPARRTM